MAETKIKTGNIYSNTNPYVLREATVDDLGGVKAHSTTELDTQAVNIDPEGFLKTKAYKAGTGINITEDGTISATGGSSSGGVSQEYVDQQVATKQDKLVSGVNIATINNQDITKGGNITIEGSGGEATPEQIQQIEINKNDIANLKTSKQDKLTAGNGIKIENNVINLDEPLGNPIQLYKGGLDGNGLENNYNTRIRSTWISTEGKLTLRLKFKNNKNEIGYRIGASYYKDNKPDTIRFASSGWQKPVNDAIDLILPEDAQYFRMIIAHAKDAPIDVSDFNAYYTLKEGIVNYNVFTVGNDLIKRKNIMMVQFGGGRIKGLQSFCIYNNKFYSTDGKNKIYVQDKKTYTLEKTVDLAIGHGNSFQLGNSHFAYISGWDDNKLYKIDLDTITIANTYALPTTGFTNALYDENRDLIYIFQRDTQPGSAEEAYKFIVYDPIKSQTISTTKTGIKFGAMQASDLYDDKIIVCAGLGLNHKTVPNKYMIFDTTGHLLTRIYIPIKENEPEGIAIDHTDGKMYMSFIDQIVYTLSV